jgi:hypothetical protein
MLLLDSGSLPLSTKQYQHWGCPGSSARRQALYISTLVLKYSQHALATSELRSGVFFLGVDDVR